MKPPFKIYTIELDDWGPKTTPVLKSITVDRVTKNYWWFKDRAGLEFHCRTRCDVGEYPTTRRGAWIRFLEALPRQIKEAKETLVDLERFQAVTDAALDTIDMEGN